MTVSWADGNKELLNLAAARRHWHLKEIDDGL
jgi:hypothetical protein